MGSKLTDLADLTPSADFALNSFLIGISDELEESDLEKLKFLCKGKYGIGKARLEKVKSALDLFDILREKLLLNENNIITLQSMLWILPRRDLQKRYVEFAESLGSSIHFVAPRETPENGYKHLKFHIRGRDLNTYGRSELDRLRSMISGLLLVPQEFVIITGIEPSNSLMITVMVPEEFAVNLFSSPPERLVMLNDVSVSHIEMGDSFIFVQENGETKSPTFINDKMDEETRNLMLRQNQMEKELENAHNKVATLTETIASMKRGDGSQWISYFLIVLIQQYHDIYENVMKVRKLIEESALDPVDSLQKLCVFKHFRYQLEKVRQCGYDENLIYSLLDAQALVFRWQKHENLDIQIADLQNANKDLERKLCLVSWEREKLAYYHSIGVKDRVMSARDEFFLRAILQNIPLKIEQRTNVEIPEECVEYVFRRFDEDISKDDLKILLEKFNISGKSRRYAALSGYRNICATFLVRPFTKE
ncbi:uncharacterized protein LOC125675536 isoform X3 [Ostrea edulis]|uniref:uncharacterized protein LOC125675536 isoform X3 n=1 Tax=Ostrea edulis TaxID=37623 RepID=UPI00209567E0|nr:uncharacterized protein LOC125675536 isoform X3 [Ostrea edulis]